MSEAPQPPNQAEQLLLQILEELRLTKAENQNLKTEVANIKKYVTEDLTSAFGKQIEDLATGVAEGFKNRDQLINELRSVPSTPSVNVPQQGNMMSKVFEQIGSAIEKYTASPNAGNSLTDMDMETLKLSKQIQLVTLKNAFKTISKAAGLPEIPETHVVVE